MVEPSSTASSRARLVKPADQSPLDSRASHHNGQRILGCLTVIGLAICMFYALEARAQDDAIELVWEERLESLEPSNQGAYFNLAEEIADEAQTDDERELARHLFRLAGAMNRDQFGRSACLALADLATNPDDKRRYLALAELLDQQSVHSNWIPEAREETYDVATALAVAEAMSWFRRARGRRALSTLEDNNATGLFRRYADRIGGWQRFKTDATQHEYNDGEGSPVRSESQLLDILELEAALLGGEEQSWAGDLLLGQGQTLVEVDPQQLAAALGVDPTKAYYQNGRWVRAE